MSTRDPVGGLNLSCAISDGVRIYTLRYSYHEAPMTQFVSTSSDCMEEFSPGSAQIEKGSTIIVSEPLDTVSDKWMNIPNNTFTTIHCDNVIMETSIAE